MCWKVRTGLQSCENKVASKSPGKTPKAGGELEMKWGKTLEPPNPGAYVRGAAEVNVISPQAGCGDNPGYFICHTGFSLLFSWRETSNVKIGELPNNHTGSSYMFRILVNEGSECRAWSLTNVSLGKWPSGQALQASCSSCTSLGSTMHSGSLHGGHLRHHLLPAGTLQQQLSAVSPVLQAHSTLLGFTGCWLIPKGQF